MISESKRLVSIIFHGSKLITIIEDRFFKLKLYDGLINFGEAYINHNVAQSKDKETYFKFKNNISNFIETLNYIEHSNKKLRSPLLRLKRRVILLNLRVLRNINKQYDFSSPKETMEISTREVTNLEKAEPVKSSEFAKSPILDTLDTIELRSKSISSKDKILNFIRKTKKIRTRDLVEQFSAFSQRTVKRTLKELIGDGVIKREEDERAVYYSILN